MGSGTFGLPVLDAFRASRHQVTAVVTAVDKPQGRGRVMTASPIKLWAEKQDIRVLTPLKLNTVESVAELRSVAADVFVVASYGALLSKEVLEIPLRGCINVHPSLLPKYRGASPVVQALLDGEKRTGMTIMVMAAALDAGDVLLQEPVDIGSDENARDLTDRLAVMGGKMTVRAIDLIEAGRSERIPQDHARATYCSKLKKEDARLDWNWSAQKIHDHVRALSIWPGTVTQWNGRNLKILTTRLADEAAVVTREPGEILEINPQQGIRIQAGRGSLWVLGLQPEGARAMDHRDFVNGSKHQPGVRFT